MKNDTVTLSDMEAVVLGVVWRDGPCTAYHVRKEFVESPATFWSGSQGAIYPLLKKLEKLGLIEVEPDKTDKRKTKSLTVSRKGKRQLSTWYDPNLVGGQVLREFDGLRSRVFFIEVLTDKQRQRFFDHVRLELTQQQENAKERLKTETCRINKLALQGMIASDNARMDWMRVVERELDAK